MAIQELTLSYSLLVMSKNRIYAARDPWGNRPLCLGEVRSYSKGQQIETVRKRCGMELGKEWPLDADIVSTVPSSATPAALGYAKQTGIEYTEVLCKNSHAGRSFIQPNNKARQAAVRIKFGPLFESFQGKRVVLVDDSIVRGNTMGPIVKLLKENGAREVHIRVASPPIKYPCYMGINIPTKEELIAHRMTETELEKHFNADSVKYLSVAGLKTAVEMGIKNRRRTENNGTIHNFGDTLVMVWSSLNYVTQFEKCEGILGIFCPPAVPAQPKPDMNNFNVLTDSMPSASHRSASMTIKGKRSRNLR